MNCAICGFILPHGQQAELNCKDELIRHFERNLIEAKEEIKFLKYQRDRFKEQISN